MASWRSYYKRRYRKYYKKKYGGYGKRSYGQFKAAKQQADQANFVMNIPTKASCQSVVRYLSSGRVPGDQYEVGTMAINIYDLLRKSEFYQSYANMYDEFKIDNIKVKLIPTKFNVTVGDTNGAGYQSFTVYTAWDRTGLNSNQLFLSVNNDDNDGYIGTGKGGGRSTGLYCTIGSDITTYSSAESRQVSVGQNSSIVRWLKPKTIQEKGQWISTSQLKPWYYYYNDNLSCYQKIPFSSRTSIDQGGNKELDTIAQIAQIGGSYISSLCDFSPAISNNPCFLEEDPTINFKPTLLIGIYPVEDSNVDTPRRVEFNIEAEVSCSFRGLRKSKVVSSSSNPAPTPTPTINNLPVLKSLDPFSENDVSLNINNLPDGYTGCFPVNVNSSVDIHRASLDANRTYYRLTKITPQIGSKTPYYELTPQQNVVNPTALDIAYVDVKDPPLPKINAVATMKTVGGETGYYAIPLSDFTLIEQTTNLTELNQNGCVIIFDENETNNNCTVRYYYWTETAPESIQITHSQNHTTHYIIKNIDGDFTEVSNILHFGEIIDENGNITFTSLMNITNPAGEGAGVLIFNIKESVVFIDFEDMDVDPNN